MSLRTCGSRGAFWRAETMRVRQAFADDVAGIDILTSPFGGFRLGDCG